MRLKRGNVRRVVRIILISSIAAALTLALTPNDSFAVGLAMLSTLIVIPVWIVERYALRVTENYVDLKAGFLEVGIIIGWYAIVALIATIYYLAVR